MQPGKETHMAKKYKYRKTFVYEGKRYNVYGNTLDEVYRKMAERTAQLEREIVRIESSMTVAAWTEIAFKTYKANISYENYNNTMLRVKKHILSEIGNMSIKSVKAVQCQAIMNAQAGRSYSHIQKIYQELRFIFQTAVDNQLIRSNPAAKIIKPPAKNSHRRSITDHEREHFLKVAENNPRYTLFLMMLYCGCRPAEAINAIGKDISVKDDKPILHIRGTKTENSDRYVPIPDVLYQRIKHTTPFEYICPNEAHNKHSESSYNRLVKSLRRDMNISMGCKVYRNELIPPFPLAEDFVPYCLRHTYCTDLCRATVDVRKAQRLMGHATISITADIYTHVGDLSDILEAGDMINEYQEKIQKKIGI